MTGCLENEGIAYRQTVYERSERMSELPGSAVPEFSDEGRKRADTILSGKVFFYDTPVQVGLKDIDWLGTHVAHQEWPAQLNRFFMLGPLASGYAATGEERYAEVARAYILDWLNHTDTMRETKNPFFGNTLDMSIRMGQSQHGGWGGTLPTFLRSPCFDDEFLSRMLESLSRQADYLSTHLAAHGNWRISHLDALVCTSLRFPFLSNAESMLAIGIKGLRNALASQFRKDGAHIENCPSYGSWMTSVLGNYKHLADAFEEVTIQVDKDVLQNAMCYEAHGLLYGVNDSRSPDDDTQAMRGLEWIRSLRARIDPEADPTWAPPLEQVFPEAGQVCMRSAWEPGAEFIGFDASSWGGGHMHLSRLSFEYRAGGRKLVADPGIISYEPTSPTSAYGKSTQAHSTLNLKGFNQSEAAGRLLRTDFTQGASLIHACYEGGYWPMPYAWGWPKGRGEGVFGIHERILLWIKGEYILSLDGMTGEQDQSIHNVWQMSPMERWTHDPERLAWWSTNVGTNLWLQMVYAPNDVEMECFEGQEDPPRGLIGKDAVTPRPAPQLEFRYATGRQRGISAVLLAPFKGDTPVPYAMDCPERYTNGAARAFSIGHSDGTTDHVCWTPELGSAVEHGGFNTDARLVWLRTTPDGEPARLFLVEGSYLEMEGKMIFEDDSRATRFEAF